FFQEIGVQPQKEIRNELGKFQGNESFGDMFYHLMKNSYFNLKERQSHALWVSAGRNEGCVEVVIRDMGGGFDRHLQEDTSGGELFTERGQRGGVNLYLAKAIAQDHGIELKAATYQEEGGQFTVRIPPV
ncbi:MAG: ATP-binding protein, partial [Candidatus Omnitrophica bacterium]|nr:ATP-binding protein [Candidatus Omnitrophota bacterium]